MSPAMASLLALSAAAANGGQNAPGAGGGNNGNGSNGGGRGVGGGQYGSGGGSGVAGANQATLQQLTAAQVAAAAQSSLGLRLPPNNNGSTVLIVSNLNEEVRPVLLLFN